MRGSISGCLLDGISGERLNSLRVMLYRIGVVGETRAVSDERGVFSFTDLPRGEYSLAIYDPRFAPHYERMVLGEDEILDNLQISLTPAGFLSGQILDEEGQAPQRCWFTLIRAGERRGRSGYISDSGDHQVSTDGSFSTPPLLPASYCLRFAGILQKPTMLEPSEPAHVFMQKRVFDFLYPNASDIGGAIDFDIQSRQIVSGLQIRIPPPVWHTVRGKVIGELPAERGRISVMFTRDMGTLDPVGGGSGASVQSDGTFEYMAQPGRYTAEICEFSPPEPSGRTQMLRRLGTATLAVAGDLAGFRIHVSSTATD
jgi:Carboxypeptidase regulatory-like domain